jgi:hypothetical protein
VSDQAWLLPNVCGGLLGPALQPSIQGNGVWGKGIWGTGIVPKYQFGKFFGGLWNGKGWYILWPLEYISVIWCILWQFGNLVAIWYIFHRFGMLCQDNLATLFHIGKRPLSPHRTVWSLGTASFRRLFKRKWVTIIIIFFFKKLPPYAPPRFDLTTYNSAGGDKTTPPGYDKIP